MKVSREVKITVVATVAFAVAVVATILFLSRPSPLQQCESGLQAQIQSGQVLAGTTTAIPACVNLSPAQKQQAYSWGVSYMDHYYGG